MMRGGNALRGALIDVSMAMLLCCVVLPCAAQKISKWKDAAGTVHYSEQAPPANVKKTSLTLTGINTSETPVASSSSIASADDKALDLANAGQIKHMCSVARQNLKLLDSSAMMTKGSDIATTTQLRGEQREQARVEAKSQIAKYCHGQ